jgi:hypothetical protein
MNPMDSPITICEETDPAIWAAAKARREKCERNWAWLEEHAAEVYSHRGKYLCIAGQELFVGDSAEDVIARARAAHPDDDGRFTRYIPKEKVARIYGNQGSLAAL